MPKKDNIKVVHTAKETKLCCLPAYSYKMEVTGDRNYRKKKMSCRSFPIDSGTVIRYLIMIGIICGCDFLFKDIGM